MCVRKFRNYLIYIFCIFIGLSFACEDASNDTRYSPEVVRSISGTLTFYTDLTYTTLAENTPGAMVLIRAIDLSTGTEQCVSDLVFCITPMIVEFPIGIEWETFDLDTTVSTVDYEIENIADGDYAVFAIVFNGGGAGILVSTDFAGVYGDISNATNPLTLVTIDDGIVTGIDIPTVPYSVWEAAVNDEK